jgi:hypothetical protein
LSRDRSPVDYPNREQAADGAISRAGVWQCQHGVTRLHFGDMHIQLQQWDFRHAITAWTEYPLAGSSAPVSRDMSQKAKRMS